MLTKPEIKDEKIITCIKNAYRLDVVRIAFLPIGADQNTAVYRIVAGDGTPYFVKLRRGDFDEASVAIPKFLSDIGIKQVIPSLLTKTGQLWANLEPFKVILYPFVEGHNGFEVNLSDRQRIEFGAALKKFHTAKIPPALTKGIRQEIFSPQWREQVTFFLERIQKETFVDHIASEMAAFLKNKSDDTDELIKHSERLARALQAQTPEYNLCHGDIHAWNLLVAANGALYLVDWDTLIFAPKERDLMFVGAGLGGSGHTLQEEETLFYQGYGQTEVNPIAMAYYRYERIIEDIAVYCVQIFFSDEGGEDRERALENLKSNYLPNSTIEIACQSDKTL